VDAENWISGDVPLTGMMKIKNESKRRRSRFLECLISMFFIIFCIHLMILKNNPSPNSIGQATYNMILDDELFS